MYRYKRSHIFLIFLLFGVFTVLTGSLKSRELSKVRNPLPGLYEQFVNPPQNATLHPYWFWNDKIEDTETVRQIDEMIDKGISGTIILPFIGLETPFAYSTKDGRTQLILNLEEWDSRYVVFDTRSVSDDPSNNRQIPEMKTSITEVWLSAERQSMRERIPDLVFIQDATNTHRSLMLIHHGSVTLFGLTWVLLG